MKKHFTRFGSVDDVPVPQEHPAVPHQKQSTESMAPVTSDTEVYQLVHPLMLHPDPNNPRKTFSEESIIELANSILAEGLLQPICARPMPTKTVLPGAITDLYIEEGERRFKAWLHILLNHPEHPIVKRYEGRIPTIVKSSVNEASINDPKELAEFRAGVLVRQVIENKQREDLAPMELFDAIFSLSQHMSHTQIALRTGLSQSHIGNVLRIQSLPDEIKKAARENPGEYTLLRLFQLMGGKKKSRKKPTEDRERKQRYELRIRQLAKVRSTFDTWRKRSSGAVSQKEREILLDLQTLIKQLLQSQEHAQ
jgi:ParB-like chromosome segregation protein Spo0J